MHNGDRFHLDMTPLVDVAFLLLTFFMFATTMSEPRVMEVAVPPDLEGIPVRESELVTLYVRHDGRLFYANGAAPRDYVALDIDHLADFSVQRNAAQGNRLITILKVDPDAKYETMVAVLDRLNMAEGQLTDEYSQRGLRRDRRFSIMPLEPEAMYALNHIIHRAEQ